jgi:hypothetical protein
MTLSMGRSARRIKFRNEEIGGAYDEQEDIPGSWRNKLTLKDKIEELAELLHERSSLNPGLKSIQPF